MDKSDKLNTEPSFPFPYDVFNEELAPHIEKLRIAYPQLEQAKNKWDKVVKNMDGISPFHTSHGNLEATARLYQKNIRELEGDILVLEAQTTRYMERLLKEDKAEPELAKQVMDVLDEKLHPEKYENKSPVEEKQIDAERKVSPSIESLYQGKNKNEAKEIREQNRDKIPVDTDYYLSLLKTTKIDSQKKIERKEKQTDVDKQVPNLGYLDYQLTVQKPLYKSPEEKNKSKRKDDKTMDME